VALGSAGQSPGVVAAMAPDVGRHRVAPPGGGL